MAIKKLSIKRKVKEKIIIENIFLATTVQKKHN